MNINYVKVSPAQNMTVFITNYVPKHAYTRVAQTIMQYDYVHAEQVGFIVSPKKSTSILRLDMSGGEFCGNGVLAAAAYARYKGLTSMNDFFIEASGTASALRCFVEETSPHVFDAKAEMPSPRAIEPMSVKVGGRDIQGTIVHMDGIAHFLIEEWLKNDDFSFIMKELTSRLEEPAIGIISYRERGENDYEMRPFVYVKTTQAECFERACGSGSLALGAALHQQDKGDAFNLRQPGGIIRVEMSPHISISTTVRFTCEGMCFVDDM